MTTNLPGSAPRPPRCRCAECRPAGETGSPENWRSLVVVPQLSKPVPTGRPWWVTGGLATLMLAWASWRSPLTILRALGRTAVTMVKLWPLAVVLGLALAIAGPGAALAWLQAVVVLGMIVSAVGVVTLVVWHLGRDVERTREASPVVKPERQEADR